MPNPAATARPWPEKLPMYEPRLFKLSSPRSGMIHASSYDQDMPLCVCEASYAEAVRRWRIAPAAEALATALTLYLTVKHNKGHNSDEALAAEVKLLDCAQAYERACK